MKIGILGGMGHFATINLYRRIISSIKVSRENQYPHIVINSNPKIPSRTRAFLFNETSPVKGMIREAKVLENTGVDYILIPCNSAHYFLPEVKKSVKTEIVDMVKLTCDYIKINYPKAKKVGIVGGEVILRSTLYDDLLPMETVKPEKYEELRIRKMIDDVKHNKMNTENINDLTKIMDSLIKKGAELVILACTELPLIPYNHKKVPVIDSTQRLVEYVNQ